MPVACSCGSVVTPCSSCTHTWRGGSACMLMSNRLTSSLWSRVSLERSWRGCLQTAIPMITMTSSMAVVTCVALPHRYTTHSRVVLASRLPMTAVVVAGCIGLGAHILGACCHRGAGAPLGATTRPRAAGATSRSCPPCVARAPMLAGRWHCVVCPPGCRNPQGGGTPVPGLRCGVVWCAEGAVTKRQWLGCLAYGNSKTGRGVCVCTRSVLCVPRCSALLRWLQVPLGGGGASPATARW